MTIGEALRLRSWARSVLASGHPAAPPAAGESAWRIFLQSERCAAGLRERLGDAGAALPALVRAADREVRHVQRAREELRAVAAVARAENLRVVVLKGGVPVAEGASPLDLDDLDLLANGAGALAAALERRGYAVRGYRSAHSLRSRVGPSGVPVEIHLSLTHQGEAPAPDVFLGAKPLAGIEGLWMLAPADHAWHVLHHGVVLHPERRGRLRELLLVRDALARCTAAERAEVERRASPGVSALGATLELADLRPEGVPGPEDPFVDTAAARMVLVEFFGRCRFPALIEPAIGNRVFARLFPPRPPVPAGLLDTSGVGHVAWLERRVPGLARVWRGVLHGGESAIASVIARPLAAILQGRASRALRSLAVE